MIGCGFSLMIPSAEAARNTDDLRTAVTPVNGAEDGGCGKKDIAKQIKGYVTQFKVRIDVTQRLGVTQF